MSSLPAAYAWLAREAATGHPLMLVEALRLFGTVEVPGAASSPIILGWAKEVGLERVYTADATAWCGLFLAVVAHRARKTLPNGPLWALNWGKWGQDGGQPELGDVLVFIRPGGGHVGLYVGEDAHAYHVLGGNQSDAVTIARIGKSRLRACRQLYDIGRPTNVRPIVLGASGALSTDEA